MDKSKVNEPERVIDLVSYYPDYLKNIRELKKICEAEDQELTQLYQKSDQLWADGFIQTATAQGLKRWETLMGMKPYPDDSVEERRTAVLVKWNQHLPYTLKRLQERLNTVVGADGYELAERSAEYKLELSVLNQTLRVLQDIRDMTRMMLPANLLLVFSGRYPHSFSHTLDIGGEIKFRWDFHPRNNREYLVLDGSWVLDGGYFLKGYKDNEKIDFYPAVLHARNYIDIPWMYSNRQYLVSDVKGNLLEGSSPEFISVIETGGMSGIYGSCGSEIETQVSDTLLLRVENNLWYLDGSHTLEENLQLNSSITKYDL